MKILLKNATIINEKSSFHNQKLDLLIVDGILSKIENNIDSEADKIIEIIDQIFLNILICIFLYN